MNPLQDELFIQYRYMPSYSNCSCLFCVSYCSYFNIYIWISSQNKHHPHSRHLASYLVYESEGVVYVKQRERDIQTNLLYSSVGLVD